MDWTQKTANGQVIGLPVGRVDEATWELFSQRLIEAVREARAGGMPLVIDLSGLDYMSSRGLRSLTMAKREAGEAVPITLAAPNDRMREILAISRYDKLFAISDSRPDV